jgi:pilus assembly protein CpaC
MGADNSRIQFGQTASGNLSAQQSEGTLSATISNLFPKLNAAKSAGYARTIQSGMVIVRDGFTQGGQISKDTTIPFALGTGDFTKATSANVGLTLDVKPSILEQEKIELGINLRVNIAVPSGGANPITTNNSIATNVILKSKESAAIGGVVQNTSTTDYDNTGNDPAPTTATAGQAPATPLFRLYRSKSYSTNKSQYVIFVTPEIIESASAGTEEIRKKFRRRE